MTFPKSHAKMWLFYFMAQFEKPFPDKFFYLSKDFRVRRAHANGYLIKNRQYEWYPERFEKRLIFKDRWVPAAYHWRYETEIRFFALSEAVEWLRSNYKIDIPIMKRYCPNET